MIRHRTPRGRGGLTLIELLLTLTILALAGVIVAGSFNTGLRAWRSAQRHGHEELVAALVAERLSAQLRSAVQATVKRDGADKIAFMPTESSLRFVTIAGLDAIPMQVSYGIEGDGQERQLVYRRYPWPDKRFSDDSRPESEKLPEEPVAEVVGMSVKEVKWRSGDPGGQSGAAAGDWDPEKAEMLPESVTVDLEVKSGAGVEPKTISVTVPLLMEKPKD
jgi:prepilin-type N-terminal cleavage/methylation domain-containing protein